MNEALDFAVPLWAWFALGGAIVVMLAIDLFLHRDDHVVSLIATRGQDEPPHGDGMHAGGSAAR